MDYSFADTMIKNENLLLLLTYFRMYSPVSLYEDKELLFVRLCN